MAAVGADVRLFKKGDRVFGSTGHRYGAYAEYLSVAETGCITTPPESFGDAEAAAIVWGGATALHFLREAGVRRGQRVLVYGASGSVGTSAVQIAKHLGADVTAVCSGSNIGLVESLGANRVINYQTTDFTKGTAKYDVIVEAVGKASIGPVVDRLADAGTLVHVVATPATSARIRWRMINTRKRFVGGTFTPDAQLINEVKELAVAGALKPVIDRVYPLADIVAAHRYVDLGHKKGDVVLTIAGGQAAAEQARLN